MAESNFNKLEITKIIPETRDTKTFLLKPIGWKPEYKAGQFLTVIFNSLSGEKRRSYSFSSSPDYDEPLSITVKRMDNGEFSRHFTDKLQTGDILQTSGIFGFFCLPETTDKKQIFFLAAGSGITPCFSLIKSALASTHHDIVLIYSSKKKHDTIFYEELNLLSNKFLERLKIIFIFSEEEISGKRLSKDVLSGLLNKFMISENENILFYICGPFEYNRMCVITLLSVKIKPENIRKENFNYPIEGIKIKPPDTSEHRVILNLNKVNYEIKVKFPVTILGEAKKHHIPIPYSCEAGRCGSCAAICIEGSVWMSYNEVLTDKEIREGYVLTCQGYPVNGDVILDFKPEKLTGS